MNQRKIIVILGIITIIFVVAAAAVYFKTINKSNQIIPITSTSKIMQQTETKSSKAVAADWKLMKT